MRSQRDGDMTKTKDDHNNGYKPCRHPVRYGYKSNAAGGKRVDIFTKARARHKRTYTQL